ncbi:hypothetical protein OKW50_003503 [Paraburkholderia youngii]|uniref:Uncharacterized protein n=1 Tax=Paraburkholderia youngii TaxID=2782701 RepID=A0A7W8L6Z7_9BURK|nr:hypothetical protein [Paraburkholderia youngii]MBB5401645.1 hypothetical protein [Paraburkholderia youngii]
MKADGNGTFFQQHRQHRVVVDEAFVSNARGYRGLRLEAREMRLQKREPPSVAHRIHDRANVAEDGIREAKSLACSRPLRTRALTQIRAPNHPAPIARYRAIH